MKIQNVKLIVFLGLLLLGLSCGSKSKKDKGDVSFSQATVDVDGRSTLREANAVRGEGAAGVGGDFDPLQFDKFKDRLAADPLLAAIVERLLNLEKLYQELDVRLANLYGYVSDVIKDMRLFQTVNLPELIKDAKDEAVETSDIAMKAANKAQDEATNAKIAALRTDLTAAQDKITDLETAKTEFDKKFTETDGKILAVHNYVDDMGDALTDVMGKADANFQLQIDDIKAQAVADANTAKTHADGLAAAIRRELETDVNSLQTKITAVDTRLTKETDRLDSRINATDANVMALTGRVTIAEAELVKVQNSVSDVRGLIHDVSITVQEVEGRTLEQFRQQRDRYINDTLETLLSQKRTLVTNLEAKLALIEAKSTTFSTSAVIDPCSPDSVTSTSLDGADRASGVNSVELVLSLGADAIHIQILALNSLIEEKFTGSMTGAKFDSYKLSSDQFAICNTSAELPNPGLTLPVAGAPSDPSDAMRVCKYFKAQINELKIKDSAAADRLRIALADLENVLQKIGDMAVYAFNTVKAQTKRLNDLAKAQENLGKDLELVKAGIEVMKGQISDLEKASAVLAAELDLGRLNTTMKDASIAFASASARLLARLDSTKVSDLSTQVTNLVKAIQSDFMVNIDQLNADYWTKLPVARDGNLSAEKKYNESFKTMVYKKPGATAGTLVDDTTCEWTADADYPNVIVKDTSGRQIAAYDDYEFLLVKAISRALRNGDTLSSGTLKRALFERIKNDLIQDIVGTPCLTNKVQPWVDAWYVDGKYLDKFEKEGSVTMKPTFDKLLNSTTALIGNTFVSNIETALMDTSPVGKTEVADLIIQVARAMSNQMIAQAAFDKVIRAEKTRLEGIIADSSIGATTRSLAQDQLAKLDDYENQRGQFDQAIKNMVAETVRAQSSANAAQTTANANAQAITSIQGELGKAKTRDVTLLVSEHLDEGDYDFVNLPSGFDMADPVIRAEIEKAKLNALPKITRVAYYFDNTIAKAWTSSNTWGARTNLADPANSERINPACLKLLHEDALANDTEAWGGSLQCRINFRAVSNGEPQPKTEDVFFEVRGNADIIRIQKTTNRAYDQYVDVRESAIDSTFDDYDSLKTAVTNNSEPARKNPMLEKFTLINLDLARNDVYFVTKHRQKMMDLFFVPPTSGRYLDITPTPRALPARPYAWVRSITKLADGSKFDLYLPGLVYLKAGTGGDSDASSVQIPFKFTPYRAIDFNDLPATTAECPYGYKAPSSMEMSYPTTPCRGWNFIKGYEPSLGLAETTQQADATKSISIKFQSPLVLSFNPGHDLQTLDQRAEVEFDLDHNGRKEAVGWVAGADGAFLSLDLNENGKIDDGHELFGQATKLERQKTKANNGYIALGQYDDNGDHVIDAKDKIFSKLLLWFDLNKDGVSQKFELFSMEEKSVTSLDLAYTDVSHDKQFQNGNKILLQSKFHGPVFCPASGCTSYDVYFGASIELGRN